MVREQLSSFSPRYLSVYEYIMCCAKLVHFAINSIAYLIIKSELIKVI